MKTRASVKCVKIVELFEEKAVLWLFVLTQNISKDKDRRNLNGTNCWC